MAGKILANQVQLGDSATATQNFVLQTNADGTAKLSRGNAGATTQDILTIDINGKYTFPQGLAARLDIPSMVRLNGANGYGSTNTKYRRFTSIVANVGTDITYSDSATLGATFTLNVNGVYSIAYGDMFNAGANIAIGLNDNQGTTGPTASTANNIILGAGTTTANQAAFVSTIMYFPAGTVITAKSDGAASGAAPAYTHIEITRIS